MQTLVKANLTPSEQVLLRADEFVREAGALDTINAIGKISLVHRPGFVQAMPLSIVLFSVALLWNAHLDNIRLEIAQPQGFLSFLNKPTIMVHHSGDNYSWPANSLEARIMEEIWGYRKISVKELVHDVLEKDYVRYMTLTPTLVKESLTGRSILVKDDNSLFSKVAGPNYFLSQTAIPVVQAYDTAWLHQLLSQTQQSNPVMWNLLQTAIRQGIESRNDTSPSE